MKRTTRTLAVGTVSGVVLSLTAMVGPASASHVECGDVITEDTTLDSSVGPCDGTGLIIGADGITLDLGRNRVFGNGDVDGPGILVEDRQGVVIVNGATQFFGTGVAIVGGSGNTVRNHRAIDNVGGGNWGEGILLDSTHDNVIRDNVLSRNGPYAGITFLGGSSGNTVDRNLVEANNFLTSPTGPQQDDGIRLENFANNNLITRNRVYDNGLDGIALFADTFDNVVRQNDVRRNGAHDQIHRQGDGIAVFNRATGNLVEENRVFDNGANGIFLRGPITTGSGAVIPGATNNDVLNNFTGNNGPIPGPGGARYDLRDNNPNCDENTWFGNTYLTAFPECTTAGGSGPAVASATTPASAAASAASDEPEVGSTSSR